MHLYEFDQQIQELSYTDPGVKNHLKKLGYRSAGEGGDQSTWLAPDGTILKIFGTQEGRKGLTEDHRMFIFWANFSKKNASNPYMPRFSAWKEFEFPQGSGQTYLQIRMEKLTELPEDTKELLDQFDWAVEIGLSYSELHRIVAGKLGRKFATTNPLVKDATLYNLIAKIKKIGNRHGWALDLHVDNYMSRGGQVVIVDPWVASS